MPQPIKTQTTTTKWWTGVINVQSVIYLGMAIVFCVGFVIRVNTHDTSISENKKDILLKADKTELKAVDEKVNRQYENNSKINERINALEKQLEYQKGFREGQEEANKSQLK